RPPSLASELVRRTGPAAGWRRGAARRRRVDGLAGRGSAGRAPAAPLPLRRLRVRGRALLLAMPGLPRLGHVSSATARRPVMNALPSRERIEQSRVLVVGDAMLDRYWLGAVDRISP